MATDQASLHATGLAGRNLTYGLLDALGRAIVTGRYEKSPFPTEAELAKQHAVSRSVPQHHAVLSAIQARDAGAAEAGMIALIADVMILIADAGRKA